MMRKEWKEIAHNEPKMNVIIKAKIRHCNPRLELPDKIVKGYMGEDNFYFIDGGELSWNWNIIEWREGEE